MLRQIFRFERSVSIVNGLLLIRKESLYVEFMVSECLKGHESREKASFQPSDGHKG